MKHVHFLWLCKILVSYLEVNFCLFLAFPSMFSNSRKPDGLLYINDKPVINWPLIVGQSTSSDMSPQSLSVSQTYDSGMQRPLSHVNWSDEQVGKVATHANTLDATSSYQLLLSTILPLDTLHDCDLLTERLSVVWEIRIWVSRKNRGVEWP